MALSTDSPCGTHEMEMRALAERARAASLVLATLSTEAKNEVLHHMAEALPRHTKRLLEANARDMDTGATMGLSSALLDRLALTDKRIEKMAKGVREVIELPDPAGELIETLKRPNGLRIEKVRVPIGVIAVIYESRPNVTIDCAALCLKAGNATILRGGKEAIHTNGALADIIDEAVAACAGQGAPSSAVQLVRTTDRQAMSALLKLDNLIHCIIPRGGEGLIRYVAENSRIPVIKHYLGICAMYIDKDVDPELAERLVLNAKTQRPGVCNAIENLFIHEAVAADLWPRLARALIARGVELRGDEQARRICQSQDIDCRPATKEDFQTEYLDLILSVKIVPSLEAGIDAINTYGSQHSDGIVTRDEVAAQRFLNGVDSATVYHNASTRFTDGFQFGLGAEIGISTDRLHARGPMGLRELCTYKYRILGDGQIVE